MDVRKFLLFLLLLFSLSLHASFIESTMGTAVVNDATAVYYNPAALALLKNAQAISLNSTGKSRTKFEGQTVQSSTGFTQSGSSVTENHYFLPGFYVAKPLTKKFTIGFTGVSNLFGKDVDSSSILRYDESSNTVRNYDLVPAAEYKLNDFISLGAGLNFSYAYFLLRPTLGAPNLNIPDTESRNEADGTGFGKDIGLLLKPTKTTLIGFNYRSSITYKLSGTSVFESIPEVVSNNYGFTFWTPARSVLSVSQAITKNLGLIGTLQRINWSIFNTVNIHGIATKIGAQPVILNASVPFFLHDTWLATIGGQYKVTPNWIVRIASSYVQSPGNPSVQVTNGDSIVLGTTMGYKISKNVAIDGGYAHAFIQNQNINITSGRNRINGVTNGFVNAASLKLTFNFV